MDFRDQVFLSVTENLSFSKASKELFISQPAVTNHIKELENKLDTRLFERKGNKIYLTNSGELVYRHLKAIKHSYRDLEFELGQLNQQFKGRLNLAASSTISQYIIPKVLADFNKRYPEIQIYLYNGNSFEVEQKLLNNEVDLALVENDSLQANLNYNNFLDDELIVIASANSVYSKRKFISVTDFLEIPVVLREKGSGTLEVINNALSKNNIDIEKLNIFIHLGSTESIKNFLFNFEGIAIVSEKAVERELHQKTLIKLAIKNLILNRKLRYIQRKGPSLSMPKLFIKYLLEYNF